MSLHEFLIAMPKVELHVHLEGAVPPATLLKLAARNGIDLPARTVEEVRRWFAFRDFPHFVEIYLLISRCLQSTDDIELVALEFLRDQAAQQIRHTEFTYTPYTHLIQKGLSIADQHAALNRARRQAEREYGVTCRMIFDIAREVSPEAGLKTAEAMVALWSTPDHGLAALGLGGYEVGHPADKFAAAFALARAAGIPLILHAGETDGPASIRAALAQGAVRLGHGVRCYDEPALVAELRDRAIPLEVCPSSNVCLGVVPSLAQHPLPRLLADGLTVTLNSDDPPFFDTTLTQEYLRCADAFGFGAEVFVELVATAVRVSRLPEADKARLLADIHTETAALRRQYGV
ncbi:MAG: adenosine deaminase [Anaerolineae bacterium]|nr:adenosine deaminase [Anaerolineae bacterium]